MIEELSFVFFSVLVIGFFLIAVFSKKMLHSLTALAAGMVFLSGFYFLLDAEFLGAIQIIVYSGAILGIYSFAMMFFDTNLSFKENFKKQKSFYLIVLLGMTAMLLVFLSLNSFNASPNLPMSKSELFDLNKQLSFVIFSKYLLAFEFIAILLLIALVCVVVLTGKEFIKDKK